MYTFKCSGIKILNPNIPKSLSLYNFRHEIMQRKPVSRLATFHPLVDTFSTMIMSRVWELLGIFWTQQMGNSPLHDLLVSGLDGSWVLVSPQERNWFFLCIVVNTRETSFCDIVMKTHLPFEWKMRLKKFISIRNPI